MEDFGRPGSPWGGIGSLSIGVHVRILSIRFVIQVSRAPASCWDIISARNTEEYTEDTQIPYISESFQ